jgi:monomeric sarcosine oxidase
VTESVDVAVVGLGALGSATAYQLASRGVQVVGLEQFELGHHRGASHDTSRILRRSYHTPAYVRLAGEAYDDWAALSDAAGEQLVTTTGGIDLFPPNPAIPVADYTSSLAECGIHYELLDPASVAAKWPRIHLPDGGLGLYQADTGIVHAAHTVATLQRLAVARGAELREHSPARVLATGPEGVALETPDSVLQCRRLVVTADAWTNEVLAGVGVELPLTVTQEQVTYFRPDRPDDFAPGAFPVWIWMDEPSFYGFPTYGEAAVKAGQDVGGEITTAGDRSFTPNADNLRQLTDFMSRTFPGSAAEVLRTVTCLYTLTPDRDFVVGTVPEQPDIIVGLGAGHGFKFTPAFGRMLADLAIDGKTRSDISAFTPNRPALTDPAFPLSWLV